MTFAEATSTQLISSLSSYYFFLSACSAASAVKT